MNRIRESLAIMGENSTAFSLRQVTSYLLVHLGFLGIRLEMNTVAHNEVSLLNATLPWTGSHTCEGLVGVGSYSLILPAQNSVS